ncbi:MAG: hypothetical protein WCQ91_00735 [Planctomycetota bacterium]
MVPTLLSTALFAATQSVQHRISSVLVNGFSQWWQMPLFVFGLAAVAVLVLWMYRRDATEVPFGVGVVLATLRLGALAAMAAAYLDFERTAEHEIVFPSRVAVLVDSSASMTLDDAMPGDDALNKHGNAGTAGSRSQRAIDVLDRGALLESLAATHEVSVWRFDADAESLVVLPAQKAAKEAPPESQEIHVAGSVGIPWRERLAPSGFETRIGETLVRVIDQEPDGVLAAVIVLSDGANNAGLDPAAAGASLAQARVPVFAIGIGSERLPTNVRIADVLVPSRVFPGDRFAVTAYLQAQGFAGQTVKVELSELAADANTSNNRAGDGIGTGNDRAGRLIDATDVLLNANGELSAVRFDVPGLESPGRRTLLVRVVPPAADHTPADNRQSAEIEVVDRITQVLLMAGGPSRQYQFMRNVLERDKSFAVDVLLGTGAIGVSQDARRILDVFPATADELAAYDVIIGFDYDWRRLDPAAQSRLERWVSRESGGLVLVAGNVFMDTWLADPQTAVLRNLYPVELKRSSQRILEEPAGFEKPMPLVFSRDGQEAEFLWLGASRIASQTVWSELKGVFSCYDATIAKPGATVYARVNAPGGGGARRGLTSQRESGEIYMAGQFYGSGNVFFMGSGELWRLRAIDDAVFERFTTQLVRHVSQGRLLRGSRRARILVERDRFSVGSNVIVRVAGAEGETSGTDSTGSLATCQAIAPDGSAVRVPMVAEPSRPGIMQGSFVASREGAWRIDVDLGDGADEKLSRRIQARLPDRELEQPRLNRGLLEQLATLSGGQATCMDDGWNADASRALAARIPDRSRREYETGAPDSDFKQRLNSVLLAVGVGLLCLEWIVRRLVKLA